MNLSGSTKPVAILHVGALASASLGVKLGGWWWLFAVAFILGVVFDSCRVAVHEHENGCS